ncbi:MAG TPA: hybrid sensor histidine kinase/response regulator [Alphaproteobacteria bacterium]|nr:hybrid sensor histidine kinase/response regulator [Alphaproteobacteria bacterium]
MESGVRPATDARLARRVLIVDDDVDFAESLCDILEPQGYVLATARTPAEARECLKTFDAKVALVDIQLRGMSGTRLIAQLKDERPGLTFIMMTAYADVSSAIEALRSGAHDYILKQIDPRGPVLALERCFEKLQLQYDYKAAYEELLVAKTAAEAASKAKSEFLATMSHELRTPLNAIIGFSEFLMDETIRPNEPAKVTGYLRAIHESGHHLLAVINDILDHSKAEAGRLEVSEEEVNVEESIAAALRVVAPRARSGGLEIATTIAPDLPLLRGDSRLLRQILLNLLSNSIKFTPSGGKVDVAAAEEDGGLAIQVRDTGIGMKAEDIPKAFEPFRQIDNRFIRKYQGTGLGLSLVKAMVEAHSGTIAVHSAPGAGTTVTIRFPASRVVQPQPPLRAAG